MRTLYARALPLPDGSVNLAITSPPYNCRAAYDGYNDWLPWERLPLQQRPYCRWRSPGANGQPWSAMVAPPLWATLEQIGFLPREQLTWIKALKP